MIEIRQAWHVTIRSRVLLLTGLVAGLFFGPSVFAVVPLPTYPDCGVDGTVAACPPDLSRNDGSAQGDAWQFANFIPDHMVRVKGEDDIGSGTWSTAAWRETTGEWDVVLAVLDCGIRWHKDSIKNKVRLNTSELPPPLGADGQICANYDCDGNGLTNVMDYADDYRVDIASGQNDGDNLLDPSDLIATFSNGVDDDGDGYIDNIAGWDFFWNDNEPYTSNDFYHMTSVLEEAAAEGGQRDSVIGHCPNCSLLPVRISDSFVGEGDKIAEGILYAVDHGANVIGMALGSMTNPDLLISAMQYAWDHDVTIVAAAGDELGFHHNYPGANDHALYVHSIKYFPNATQETAMTTLGFFGCNNYGARLDLVAPSSGCATGSVAATLGVAGLVYSRAMELGITLSSSEARQLLLRNVYDINEPESQIESTRFFPSDAGWDLFFGEGRINAFNSVRAVAEGRIPPEVAVTAPGWFEYIDPAETPVVSIEGEVAAPRAGSYEYLVEWAPGADPQERDYRLIKRSATLTAPFSGELGTLYLGDIDPAVLDMAASTEPLETTESLLDKSRKLNSRAITFRVQVIDDSGVTAVERKQAFLIQDDDLLTGFPIKLGSSGDSSPVLYDLNDDGRLNIILATSDGRVHVFDHTGAELPGWPIQVGLLPLLDPLNPDQHLDQDAYASGEISSDVRQGIIGTPAVGDLEGDGIPEVVVGTLEGSVWAFDASGVVKPGFPVQRDPVSDADTNRMTWYDPGMFAATVLYDLDNDGALEIIQASMDQKVYVWRYDGSRQGGFPVKLENPDGSTGISTVSGRIVSSPAVGDLDGDGLPEIVVGANEYDKDEVYRGYAYAIHGDGTLNPNGTVLPGWPVELIGLLGGVIMYIGEGTSPSPTLADFDGDGVMEIVLSGVASQPTVLRPDGRTKLTLGGGKSNYGDAANTNESSFWAIIANSAVADLDGDGDLEVMLPGTGFNFFLALGLSQYQRFDHLAAAWHGESGEMVSGFPRVVEDISFFNAPAAGDITGDGVPEMLVGSSGYVLHGFTAAGTQPAGWPKFTGGWQIASPAIGDIDGDGLNEVIQPTREGYLFAWNTAGIGGNEWPSFRHDPQNTGNYHAVPQLSAGVQRSTGLERAQMNGPIYAEGRKEGRVEPLHRSTGSAR